MLMTNQKKMAPKEMFLSPKEPRLHPSAAAMKTKASVKTNSTSKKFVK
jgi:hypothetical protein